MDFVQELRPAEVSENDDFEQAVVRTSHGRALHAGAEISPSRDDQTQGWPGGNRPAAVDHELKIRAAIIQSDRNCTQAISDPGAREYETVINEGNQLAADTGLRNVQKNSLARRAVQGLKACEADVHRPNSRARKGGDGSEHICRDLQGSHPIVSRTAGKKAQGCRWPDVSSRLKVAVDHLVNCSVTSSGGHPIDARFQRPARQSRRIARLRSESDLDSVAEDFP